MLLNARGWKNAQIADCLNWAEQTVRQTIHRWQAKGLVGLWDATGRGGQQRWPEEDMVYLLAFRLRRSDSAKLSGA